jgi:regulator of sigma D
MNILRKTPYPLSASYEGLEPSTDYLVTIESSSRFEDAVFSETVTTNGTGDLVIVLPEVFGKYDESYALTVTDELGDIVVEDNLNILRPYVDPASLSTATHTEAENTKFEALARAIIDSVSGGFYFEKDWIEVTGEGNDYMPLWDRAYKVLKAYENSVLDYDSTQDPPALGEYNYLITQDKSSIIKDPTTPYNGINRLESAPQKPPLVALSDSISPFETDDSGVSFTFKPGSSFPKGVDYLFEVEMGYKVVPQDIKDATLMLIDDIACGRLDYYKRYVTSYSTDQFRIQMDKSVLDGTGNILVDKILDKYVVSVKKPRML